MFKTGVCKDKSPCGGVSDGDGGTDNYCATGSCNAFGCNCAGHCKEPKENMPKFKTSDSNAKEEVSQC